MPYCRVDISRICYYVKAEKEELKMSPSVQCLSVSMPRCSLHADSDRGEPPTMLNATCASLQAGMESIHIGIDPLNSDLAGMPLSLLRLFSCINYSVFVIMLQFFDSFYMS